MFYHALIVFMFLSANVFTSLFLCGCDENKPSPPSRYVQGIRVLGQGTNRLDSIAGAGFYAAPVYAHEDVRVGGRVFLVNKGQPGYWSTGWWTPIVGDMPDPFSLSQTSTVGRDGYGKIEMKIDLEPVGYWMNGGLGCGFTVTDGRFTSNTAGVFGASQYNGIDGGHLDPFIWDDSWPGFYGLYWRSYKWGVDGYRGKGGLEAKVYTMSDPPFQGGPDPNLVWPSQAESDFLIDESITVNRGFRVHGFQWLLKRDVGAEPATAMFPLNHSNREIIREHATPYYLSYMVVTADTIDLRGHTIAGLLRCRTYPDGIPINIEIRGMSACGTRHFAHTEYIIPIEVDFYDPDPDGYEIYSKPALVVPVHPDEQLTIEVDISKQALFTLAGLWLTDNRTADINQDGIVNFDDFALFTDPSIWSDPNSFINDPNFL